MWLKCQSSASIYRTRVLSCLSLWVKWRTWHANTRIIPVLMAEQFLRVWHLGSRKAHALFRDKTENTRLCCGDNDFSNDQWNTVGISIEESYCKKSGKNWNNKDKIRQGLEWDAKVVLYILPPPPPYKNKNLMYTIVRYI